MVRNNFSVKEVFFTDVKNVLKIVIFDYAIRVILETNNFLTALNDVQEKN